MEKFMKIAFELAKKAEPFPNPRVGAVLVKNGNVIGFGYHKKAGMLHAEIVAINDAKKNRQDIAGATLYVTLEPCSHTTKRTPPCTKAIIENKISKVIFGMKDPNILVNGSGILRRAGVIVAGPTSQKTGEKINKKYIAKLSKKPYVSIKMGMSADGKTATRTGDAKWITSPKSLEYVHKLRSKFDAVMVGAGTVIHDNPRLTSRIKNASKNSKGKNPYRIIIDGKLRIPVSSKVLHFEDDKTIVVTSELGSKTQIAKKRKIKNLVICGKTEVDLKKLMRILAAIGITRVMIEGGSELNAKAIGAGIVDNLMLFIAPKLIGGVDAKPVIGGLGILKMSQARKLKNMRFRKIGADLMLEFDVEN